MSDSSATAAFLERRIDGVMRFEKLKGRLRAIPGASTLTGLAAGWIRAPGPRAADAIARAAGMTVEEPGPRSSELTLVVKR